MNPQNKKFLHDMFDKFPVSLVKQDGTIIYYTILPDERKLALCSDVALYEPGSAIVYYTASLDDKVLEETIIDTSTTPIDPVARDMIELMRMCSLKIMAYEAHLAHSKFMIHEITNDKTHS